MDRIATEHFVFTFRRQAEPAARRLAGDAESIRRRLCDDLEVSCFEGPVRVHIAASAEEFALSQPGVRERVAEGGKREDYHIDWAAGIAYTRRNLILLRIDHTALLSLEETFVHEVSHFALRHGINHNFVPRWFLEGVAILQAGEPILNRLRTASEASLTGSLIPIRDLTFSFPQHPARIRLAYAQSALFLRWLLRHEDDRAHVRVIGRVAAGERFNEAFPKVFGASPMALWEDWRDDTREAASWIPVLTSSALLWVLLTLIFLAAYARRRHASRARLRRWEEEEARSAVTNPLDTIH